MRFLIYIPNNPAHRDCSVQQVFESVGLGAIAQGAEALPTPDGPDSNGGKIFGWLDHVGADARYLPDEQTWLPSMKVGDREVGAYWVGINNNKPPTEEGLRRPDHRKGVMTKLGDGDSWIITTPATLERFPHPNETHDGLVWLVDEKFNWLVTALEKKKATSLFPTEDKDVLTIVWDKEHDFDFMCLLLQINYRVTPEVIMHMQLLSDAAIRHIVAALMDLSLKE